MIGFLVWHYTSGLNQLLIIYNNLLYFLLHFFSIPYLIRTLLAPWKREVFTYQGPGFHIEKYLEVIVINLISRIIGMIIRTLTISAWIIITFIAIIIFTIITFFYLILPVISLPIFLGAKEKQSHLPVKLIAKYGSNSQPLFQKFFQNEFGQFIFNKLELSSADYKSIIITQNSPDQEKNFQKNITNITTDPVNLLKIFCQDFLPLKNFLEEKNISIDDVADIASWWLRQDEEKEFNQRFWDLSNLQKIRCIGKDWAYGYTINLDKFSQDLNQEAVIKPKMIGRKSEIETIERILSKRGENNVLLVGEPGVGRKTIILGLAQRIAYGKTTPELSHKRVLLFDLNSAIAEEMTIEGKRAKLLTILKEAQDAGNIILAISSFDAFIANGNGRIDLTEIFSQTISGSALQIIGISTPNDYHRYIVTNPEVLRLFEKVEVSSPTTTETINILEDLVPLFESKHKISISFFALREIIDKSSLLVTDVPFPESAINLLDEAVYYTVNKIRQMQLSKQIVDQLLSEKMKIPLGQITQTEKEKLIDLEKFLHERIIDQEPAIDALGKALRRGRLNISQGPRPTASFLFLGPTGVGKTETAKALAQLYFGSEEKMIRLDMAEFTGESAVASLIGSVDGRPGLLTSAVKDSPFTVLLLDEFEKTTPEVLNLFLPVFDEGYLKDTYGKSISFTNLIIIATSNAGAEFIRQQVNQKTPMENLSKDLVDHVLEQRIFNPEFINRFDGVIVFKPLSPDDLSQIARLMLIKLNTQLKKEHNITVKLTDTLINQVATQGFEPEFGARPMRRLIQDKIEAPIAKMLLEGKIKKGEEIEINL
ncbi:MAG: ATP-dependent Clp protease ATP-binding subunit [Candidatus Gottesmanbacteria bacterium]